MTLRLRPSSRGERNVPEPRDRPHHDDHCAECNLGRSTDEVTRPPVDNVSTTKETSMPKSPQRRDGKKVGKTLKEKREAKRAKSQDKKPLER